MTETTELVPFETLNAVQVFTGGGMNAILNQIETTVRAIPLDASTVTGRDEIRSVAYRVARTKTALDAEGKKLTEEWRKNTAKVNEERKKSVERLDALADEVRKPLTDFENKDKLRIAAHEEALRDMSGMLEMLQRYPDMPASDLGQHLIDLSESNRDRDWEEFGDRATKLRREVSVYLIGRIESRKKFDADQAELARLRAEEAARLQREHDEQLQAEAAEKARVEAERKASEAASAEKRRVEAEVEAERKRVAAEAEQVRLEHERVQREAAAKLAKEKADRLAAEALAERKRQQEENARLTAEKRAEEAEDAKIAAIKKAESDRVAAEKKAAAEKLAAEVSAAAALMAAQEKAKRDSEAAAKREREKIAAEQKLVDDARVKREADEANVVRVRTEILKDCMAYDPEFSSFVLDAIMAGKIRNIKVIY